MFKDIEQAKTWRKVEKINKGWSSDTKYYIETHDGEKFV
ncbi:MAG TPA: phosphotransferase family protein, partial [Firmicutes bacterium]|nr:phosphotransferase family protein [Bacillota bacterium]